jgi:hypothetical protein
LPDKNADPNLLDEFMNIIHLYTSQGGSLVLFGESDPLFFQANLFLENHKFPTEYGLENTYLRLCGNHLGKKILYADETGNLWNKQLFNAKEEISYPNNRNIIDFNNPAVKRPNLGNNLKKIYEGETISYAKYPNNIYPFTKFEVDSEGGISIAIYMGRNGHGDVIVDGGFTKLFLSMEEEGTYIYIKNLGAFTSRIECNFNKVVKPKTINYIVKKVEAPIKTFTRNLIIIDSQIKLYDLYLVKYKVKSEYTDGDVIFIANTKNYKISINDLENMHSFIPDLNFNNNIIIDEINKLEQNLYSQIYVLDIGEQIYDELKLGDLLLINHNIKYYYNTRHLSLNYNKNKYNIKIIKNLNQKIFDINSFNDNYIELRNYVYGTINSEDENEIKEIREIMLKIKDHLYSKESKMKYEILNWRLECVKCSSDLPIAANKYSK